MNPYDIVFWSLVLVMAFPYVAFCRLLWHAGSWFKRKDR